MNILLHRFGLDLYAGPWCPLMNFRGWQLGLERRAGSTLLWTGPFHIALSRTR